MVLHVSAISLPPDGLYHVRRKQIGCYEVSVAYIKKWHYDPIVKVYKAFTDPIRAGKSNRRRIKVAATTKRFPLISRSRRSN